MGPRGRAGFRGGSRGGGGGRGRGGGSRGGSRGGFARGGSRGGGRGRGRGGRGAAHPHRGPKFDGARVEYSDSDSDDEAHSGEEGAARSEDGDADEMAGLEDGSEDDDDDDDDDDDGEATANAKPYMALIKSLTEDADAPQAKRRKLHHQQQQQAPSHRPDAQLAEPATDSQPHDVDFVDEAEDAPDEADDEAAAAEGDNDDDDDDDDDAADGSDAFARHFVAIDEAAVARRIQAVQEGRWSTNKIPAAAKGTKLVVHAPDTGHDSDQSSVPAPVASAADLSLKHRLQESMTAKKAKLDAVEQTLAPFVFGYQDVLYCNRNMSNGKSVRRLACLHALNHVFKTRDRVIKNNAKLARHPDADLELRDQGFTRPKVLMILPTREACYKMVETMASICQPETQENRKRFDETYHDKDHTIPADKPADFRDLFAGNDDDMFRLGIKFTRKTIKFFAAFYNSDILIASPLGLRMAIGSDDGNKVEHDFLTSVEVVVVDQTDALLMQNWEHVEYVFDHLNLQPKDDHGADFARVRSWYLEDQARYFRQTILLTQFHTPETAKLFRLHCRNWAGKARIEPEHAGVLHEIGVRAKQTFSRFDAPTLASEADARFAYFSKAILPALARRSNKDSYGTLLLVPSYLDFVRVRNYFANSPAAETLTFGAISEYASVPEASRARSHFFAGRHKVLLYTERAHHFRRYVLKGVQRIIMYSLPDNPLFYKEIVGLSLAKAEQDLVVEPGHGSVRVVFSKYDVLKLERVVGSQRVGKMIRERGDTFDFV